MEFVQPIREKEKIEEFKNELLKNGSRDYMLFNLGINTGLRISDILLLRVSDVKNKTHIVMRETKTNKQKRIKINGVKEALDNYTNTMQDHEYLFKSQKGENSPISRSQAYRILNSAAKRIGIDGEIGTHTLRKTYGYHFYQKTKDIVMLQELFNHAAPSVTMRYIGINQDMMDAAMDDFML